MSRGPVTTTNVKKFHYVKINHKCQKSTTNVKTSASFVKITLNCKNSFDHKCKNNSNLKCKIRALKVVKCKNTGSAKFCINTKMMQS